MVGSGGDGGLPDRRLAGSCACFSPGGRANARAKGGWAGERNGEQARPSGDASGRTDEVNKRGAKGTSATVWIGVNRGPPHLAMLAAAPLPPLAAAIPAKQLDCESTIVKCPPW